MNEPTVTLDKFLTAKCIEAAAKVVCDFELQDLNKADERIKRLHLAAVRILTEQFENKLAYKS